MSSARSSASARRCRRRCARPQGATLAIDQATRANLELMRTLGGERRGSLLAAIDRTVTAGRLAAAGAAAGRAADRSGGDRAAARRGRAFRRATPLARGRLRAQLQGAPDLARALSRLVVGRGGPRDLAAIRDGIDAAADLAARARHAGANMPAEIAAMPRPRCAGPTPAIARELDGRARRRAAAVQARRRLRARGLRRRARRGARAARRDRAA